MSKWTIVVAVDEAWGIGKNNQLLCHLPDDLKHFKRLTMGKPILMGRKTFESIGRPLPGRRNVVLTHRDLKIEGVECVKSLEEAKTLLQASDEVMVIGGKAVYEQALPWVSTVYLTRIHHLFDADTFFPELPATVWVYQKMKEVSLPYAVTYYRVERLF